MRSGLLLLSLIILIAFLTPSFLPYQYYEMNLMHKNEPPSTSHWFGTDDLGRDLFTRCCYGARISLFIGAAAALVDLLIGSIWGGIAALGGGNLDEAMMRTADLLYSLPYKLVVILLVVVMGPGLYTLIAAMSFVGWITMARVVRGQLLELKQQPYILAAIGLGAGFNRLLFRHLLPNAAPTLIATLSMSISSAIFVEAVLSFLGLGIPPPLSSLGVMVHEGLPALPYYPWRLFFPGLLISATILGLNLVGDALQENV